MAARDSNLNYGSYALTQAWVFFLLGFILLLWLHIRKMDTELRRQTPIALELDMEVTESKLKNIKHLLTQQYFIAPESITYISPDEAFKTMSGIQNVEMDSTMNNPFRPLMCFQFRPSVAIDSHLAHLKMLEKLEGVRKVHAQNTYSIEADRTLKKIEHAFLILCLVFAAMALLIGKYLAGNFVDHKRDVIEMYVRLGASDLHLKKPYLRQVAVLGLAGSCLSVCLIGLILLLVNYVSPALAEFIRIKNFMIVVIFLLIFGPLMPVYFVNAKINRVAKQ